MSITTDSAGNNAAGTVAVGTTLYLNLNLQSDFVSKYPLVNNLVLGFYMPFIKKNTFFFAVVKNDFLNLLSTLKGKNLLLRSKFFPLRADIY